MESCLSLASAAFYLRIFFKPQGGDNIFLLNAGYSRTTGIRTQETVLFGLRSCSGPHAIIAT
jgi:hypothetical protein